MLFLIIANNSKLELVSRVVLNRYISAEVSYMDNSVILDIT